MDITVKTSYHKHFVIIVHRIGSKKLLRLFEWTVVLLDLVRLRVETKAIRNPTVAWPVTDAAGCRRSAATAAA